MQAPLSKLNVETFVFYLEKPLQTVPALNGFTANIVEPKTLEVDIGDTQNMNELFAAFSKQDIVVQRMRNKVNRLEEMFMRLVAQSKEASNA